MTGSGSGSGMHKDFLKDMKDELLDKYGIEFRADGRMKGEEEYYSSEEESGRWKDSGSWEKDSESWESGFKDESGSGKWDEGSGFGPKIQKDMIME